MTDLKRSLRLFDGLAMVVGIMVGSGIFRTPGLVAAQLGRPWLTFVAWVLGGLLALLGALCFAELATRHPRAGGKYVYVREAFGRRAAFVVGWVEGLAIYPVAIAAIAVVAGEYAGRLAGLAPGHTRWVGVAVATFFTALNLAGVATGRWAQNLATAAKVLALVGVVVLAFAAGSGTGWHTSLPGAPRGWAAFGALAVAFQAVIWTYYGYLDAGKIAEEVVDPGRTLPRILLGGIAAAAALYLLLNAAFFQVLPIDRIAASNLVPGDVAAMLTGARGGAVVAGLAVLVVVASLNGNIFVTPRVIFGLAREGLGPAALARVNAGGTPWAALLLVGAVAIGLAATGTFESLLGLAITVVLVLDSVTVLALFRLREREPQAPFLVPLFPVVPLLFIAVYAALFLGTAIAQPGLVAVAVAVLGGAYGLSWLVG
ncbi:MAG TPA: amino acid permease [Gemmatimonadales bacterium]|nr:amino acid permease [Gemmatimonadales bacterium]